MLNKHHAGPFLELSNDVQDEADWVVGQLRELDIPLSIAAFAIEPTTKLLTIGTSTGAIYIHGGPGVEVKVTTPASVGVKFLSFASSSQNLVCLDANNMLHIWDLATFGGPEYLKSVRFDQVTALTVSPSLCHIFIGLRTGEIKTYDLACLRKSEYTVPNMWKLYQQTTLAQGVPSMIPTNPSQPCVEQQLHPRDLNRMFVAYPGGVILCDLTQRSTIRAYELILPPGAPGGYGYGMDDILSHRQPEVTSFSIHPSGHFFAVGHADGSIAFWAVEDNSNPLVVRTLDDENVHHVDNRRLECELQKKEEAKPSILIREPVFKLAWSGFSDSSDPRGGQTTLTILGGLDSRNGGSVSVLLFPAFQPPDPPTDNVVNQESLHPFFRSSMCKSLVPINAHTYQGHGEIQDFLLCPRQHPHFSGNYDPYALIFLLATPENGRVIEAYQFPPPGWVCTEAAGGEAGVGLTDETQHSPDLEWNDLYHRTGELDLPFQYIHGSASVRDGRLFTVEAHGYQTIVSMDASTKQKGLQIDGGLAFADQTGADELRLTKYQPHRILITYDDRRHLRFFDLSAQLLASSPNEPLKHHFPNALSGFTVDLSFYSSIPANSEQLGGDQANINLFSFASEALELAIALADGSVLVCRPSANEAGNLTQTGSTEEEITLLKIPTNGALSPYFLVKGSGQVQACSMSDIGFLAISYSSGNVTIIDLRGPNILCRLSSPLKTRRLSTINSRLSTEPDIATALTWSITPTEKDMNFRVRLIVSRASGATEIYTLGLVGSPGIWKVTEEPIVAKGVADPIPHGTFVMDSKTGGLRKASRSLFAAALKGGQNQPGPSIVVTVGSKGARSHRNVDGERLGKVEWGYKCGSAVSAQVVERMSSKALAVVTDKNIGLAFTLPSLEPIKNFKLLPVDTHALTIDESGDFIAFTSTHEPPKTVDKVIYGTLFDIRRLRYPPEIDFGMKKISVPQPQPVSIGPTSLLGWLNFNQAVSGKQIDDMLGGPDRPIIIKSPSAPSDNTPSMAETASSAASNIAASAAAAQASLFNRLSSAINERGQLLGDLEDRFNSLETGSRDMVAQAKKLAAQQTAKSWLGF